MLEEEAMAKDTRWTNDEWRRLQTSLFAVTGTTRIRLSDLTAPQWNQVIADTNRTRADIDAALDTMLKRQELPGGRVPVQTTERLFRESVPHLRACLEALKRSVPLLPRSPLPNPLCPTPYHATQAPRHRSLSYR